MDNVTHSLVGVALADLALKTGATKAERRLFVAAGVVASNAPDVDVAYTWITPQPLGYLLHHRGHTHTIIGLLALGALMTTVCWLSPAVRRLGASVRRRLWILIAAGLASHLVLDAFNSYGVHPFYPFDSRWYYGDAVFIVEPWLWVLLGVAVAWNARTRKGRFTALGVAVCLPVLFAASVLPRVSFVALVAVGGGLAWMLRRMSPAWRAGAALAAVCFALASMVGVSRVARESARASLQPEVRGELVDLILTPSPGSPLCWSVIGVEKNETAGEFVLWRGTLSVRPEWRTPGECAGPMDPDTSPGTLIGEGRFALTSEIHQSLPALRALYQNDCWVKGWLQFGRAPVLEDGRLEDLRFGGRFRQNFTTMALKPSAEAARCPRNLTSWGMPRADLLRP